MAFSEATFSPLTRLGITVAIEHVTAVLSGCRIKGDLMDGEIYPAVHQLWIWHAMEELDHKSIAIDLYTQVGGGFIRRVLSMCLALFSMNTDLVIRTLQRLHHDGLLGKVSTWRLLGSTVFGWRGLVRLMGRDTLRIFSPGFHPDRHANNGWIDQGQQRLLALGS
jgi:predicted metal-dependent hydrolase